MNELFFASSLLRTEYQVVVNDSKGGKEGSIRNGCVLQYTPSPPTPSETDKGD